MKPVVIRLELDTTIPKDMVLIYKNEAGETLCRSSERLNSDEIQLWIGANVERASRFGGVQIIGYDGREV